MRDDPTYIDLFSGCGGLSLGFYKAGWRGLFAVEKDKMAFETLKYNLICNRKHFLWPCWLPQKNHDIRKLIKEYEPQLRRLRGEVTLVAGGPPCQGFSLAGRRKEGDSRNKLVDLYLDFVKIVKPRMVFFENVRGFTVGFKKKNSRGEAYSDYVVQKLRKTGYDVEAKIIDFSDFGIPQRRKRFILVGLRGGSAKVFFENLVNKKAQFLKRKGLGSKVTVKEAISDLERENGEVISKTFKAFMEGCYSKPMTNYQKLLRTGSGIGQPDSHRFPRHGGKTIRRFEFILKNCHKNKPLTSEIKQKFGLRKKSIIPLDGRDASPTLTTLPDDYIHYAEPRILTVREYARIQSFDDWFEFKGKYTTGGKLRKKEVPRYTQVGNAIPPIFAELSGIVLKGL